MSPELKRMDVEAAIEDVKNRTLAGISGEVAQLVYLASTRDYNTGRYYHEGVAFRFSEEVAAMALEACHQEVFRCLVFSSLEDIVRQLETYVHSTSARPLEVLAAWRKLEPYRVVIPSASGQLSPDFLPGKIFFSNVRIALATLEARQQTGPHS